MEINRRECVVAITTTLVPTTNALAAFASYQNATNLNLLLLESGDNLSLQNGELLVDP